MDNMTLALQLNTMAPSQYGNYSFDSMCVLRGKPFGAHIDGGIHLLDNADATDDNGTEIDALMELAQTDFGSPNVKKVLKLMVGYEADGKMVLTVISDEETAFSGEIPLIQEDMLKQGDWAGMVSLGRYSMLRIQNTEGCDFNIDNIVAAIIISPIRKLKRI